LLSPEEFQYKTVAGGEFIPRRKNLEIIDGDLGDRT
jgi:hypothetical protein